MTGRSVRLLAAGAAALLACGVKAPPRPPLPETPAAAPSSRSPAAGKPAATSDKAKDRTEDGAKAKGKGKDEAEEEDEDEAERTTSGADGR